jgi:MarR family transcriptional regulator, repressor for mepA
MSDAADDPPRERPTPDAFSVPALMGRIMIRMRQHGDQVTREWGLSPQAGRTLGYIEAAEKDGVVQRDLAVASGTRAASVTALVQNLERDGWIERRTDPRDSRRKTLHTTPKAREVIGSWSGFWDRAEAEILAPLDAGERETLVRLLRKIDDAYSSDLQDMGDFSRPAGDTD